MLKTTNICAFIPTKEIKLTEPPLHEYYVEWTHGGRRCVYLTYGEGARVIAELAKKKLDG